MKIVIKALIFAGIAAVLASTVAPQTRKVTLEEIERLETSARAKLKDLSYREKLSSLGYSDSRYPPDYSSISTIERQAPDRYRSIWEQKSNGKVQRNESIKIGDFSYVKSNDEAWKIEPPRGPYIPNGTGGSSNPNSLPKITVECEYLGETQLNGILSDTYQVTTTRRFVGSNGDLVNPSVKKYWFDKAGRLLKTQVDTTDSISKRLSQSIDEYQYDATIKIEAPIK